MSSDTSIIVSRLLQYPIFAQAAHERNWLVYALVDRDGKKPLKVPQLNGSNASFDDAAQYTLEEALSVSDRVGYVARKGSAMVGVDYDNCFTEDDLDDHIDAMLYDVYAEVSPSGKGVRVLLPRMAGDFWSRERNDVGFFGADNKWFTVTFDSLYDDFEFGDSAAIRRSVSHLRMERRSERNEVAALRGKKGDGGKWWFDMEREWQENAIHAALKAIPVEEANDRDVWVDLSMALHSTQKDWVKPIWDAWSQDIAQRDNPKSYDEQKNATAWNSFTIKPDGKTIAHVFYLAREHGWDQDGFKKQYRDRHKPEAPEGGLIITNNQELRETELSDIEFLIERIVPAGCVIGIAGPSSAGKTRFVSALIASASAGRTDIIGLPECKRKLRIMYCANEEKGEDLQRRLKAAAVLNGIPDGEDYVLHGKENGQIQLVNDEDEIDYETVNEVVGAVRELQLDIVVFDPFVTLGAGDENAASSAGAVMAAMHSIAAQSGCAVIFVHHTPKGDRGAAEDDMAGTKDAFRGAGVIYSALDVGLTVFPYLPPSAHAKGAEGKSYRTRLRTAQKREEVRKFVRIDPAKEREGSPFHPAVMSIEGQEVRVGGMKIGAMRPVSEEQANYECDRAVELGSGKRDLIFTATVADVLVRRWGAGSHRVTLLDLHEVLFEELGNTVWQQVAKPRADQGQMAQILEAFEDKIPSGTYNVQMDHQGRKTILEITHASA